MNSTWIQHRLSSITVRVLWKSQCITWRKWAKTSTSDSSQRPRNTPASRSLSRRRTNFLLKILSILGKNCSWFSLDSFKRPYVSFKIKRRKKKMMRRAPLICISLIRGNSSMMIAYSRLLGTCNLQRKTVAVRCTKTRCRHFSRIKGTLQWQS